MTTNVEILKKLCAEGYSIKTEFVGECDRNQKNIIRASLIDNTWDVKRVILTAHGEGYEITFAEDIAIHRLLRTANDILEFKPRKIAKEKSEE